MVNYCKYCGADLPPNKEVRDNKQIKIEELIPLLKYGYVAMDKDGDWTWFSDTPEMKKGIWFDYLGTYNSLSEMFDIAPAEDWEKSLIKIERK
ncbi:MAG: hypothetical protein UHK60_10000 [Acutalibacteraceae bacterium]|nr:hypothetical protein [Acutalibacteraceae bacterium]